MIYRFIMVHHSFPILVSHRFLAFSDAFPWLSDLFPMIFPVPDSGQRHSLQEAQGTPGGGGGNDHSRQPQEGQGDRGGAEKSHGSRKNAGQMVGEMMVMMMMMMIYIYTIIHIYIYIL